MAKIPIVAIAGLWSAITVAALAVVALDQSRPAIGADTTTFPAVAPAAAIATASVILTDATGNRYRTRRD